MHIKVASLKKVVGAIRSLVNARELQLECARVLYEVLLVNARGLQLECERVLYEALLVNVLLDNNETII